MPRPDPPPADAEHLAAVRRSLLRAALEIVDDPHAHPHNRGAARQRLGVVLGASYGPTTEADARAALAAPEPAAPAPPRPRIEVDPQGRPRLVHPPK